jgi:hypothetical protein
MMAVPLTRPGPHQNYQSIGEFGVTKFAENLFYKLA